MIGVIERIKNNVLLKCSTLNEIVINESLVKIIDTSIYRFSEDIISMINEINTDVTEQIIRSDLTDIIKKQVIKKLKRKLFIDSLALQITNDSYIEDYVLKKININTLEKEYIKELKKNKNSNQLNMTEDLKLEEIFKEVYTYIDKNINSKIKENGYLVSAVNNLIEKQQKELELKLEDMIKETDLKYLSILKEELNNEVKDEIENDEEGEINMIEGLNEENLTNINDVVIETNKFDKYDDMTLFNKAILSLNTKEENLTRKENKLEQKKLELEETLASTNKNIELNIKRENDLSQRKLELNSREIEINSKLSEAEVIFLNMKPLINGLNKIKDSKIQGGDTNE